MPVRSRRDSRTGFISLFRREDEAQVLRSHPQQKRAYETSSIIHQEQDDIERSLSFSHAIKKKSLLKSWHQSIDHFLASRRAVGCKNVEIGAAGGFLSDEVASLYRLNLLHLPSNSITADGLRLPFRDGMLDNIFLINSFHHLSRPEIFLEEAGRVLRPGGRLLLSEPFLSLLSYPLWKYLHPEHCCLGAWGFEIAPDDHHPLFDANSANATVLWRELRLRRGSWNGLALAESRFHSKFTFWAAGCYKFPQLIPRWAEGLLALFERRLAFLDQWMASFIFLTLEKRS